ncbi:MAG: MerR family transcriptional regulator [Armatimonadetes bacterium]|nr:MerR family transcriptional regulator [Armatimonadota bacterium]
MDERIQRRLDAGWLTAEALVDRATSQGIELNPRTLAYYVSVGLVPAPVRAPFPGADGRVRYYSSDAVARLRRIQSLKEQGFSLAQILKVIEGKAGTSLRRLTEAEEEEIRAHPARRLLKALASDELRRQEGEARAQVADGSDAALQQALRSYYGRLLSLAWPDENTDRLVDIFL